MRLSKLFTLLLGCAAGQAFACYTVFDARDNIVYHSEKPPVDMSRPIHETLPQRFPGGHLVFDSYECAVISSVAIGNGGPTAATTPLLTDPTTARKLREAQRSDKRS
jgi:hypothetical protein